MTHLRRHLTPLRVLVSFFRKLKEIRNQETMRSKDLSAAEISCPDEEAFSHFPVPLSNPATFLQQKPFLPDSQPKAGGDFPLAGPNLRREKPHFALKSCANLSKLRAVLYKAEKQKRSAGTAGGAEALAASLPTSFSVFLFSARCFSNSTFAAGCKEEQITEWARHTEPPQPLGQTVRRSPMVSAT